MKYDFETVVDRRNTESVKWECPSDVLPRWVADRDFKTAPEIVRALEKRAEHGIFGYTEPHDGFYDAYIRFYQKRHNVCIEKDWLLFSLGVVPTISSSVRKLTKVGDQIVLLTPVYNIFFNSVVNNNRIVREVPLINDNGYYRIDFDGLQKALKEERTKRIIFCNPANPVGRIWTKEELKEVGRLCYENGVTVLSDEIHAEIVRPGCSYIPFFSVSEINRMISVNAISVTKAFNLAGIHTSAIVIPDEGLRTKVNRQINTDEVAEPNVFSCLAAQTALDEGGRWLDERRQTVFSNRDYVSAFVRKEIPQIQVIQADATYLLWIDVQNVTKDSAKLSSFLKEKAGLWVQDGSVYGKGGKGFLRRNVACPFSLVKEGCLRLKKGIGLFRSGI